MASTNLIKQYESEFKEHAKPCPLCGSPVRLTAFMQYSLGAQEHTITCTNSECRLRKQPLDLPVIYKPEEIIKYWNEQE